MSDELAALRTKLTSVSQTGVLRFFDRLNEGQRKRLTGQLAALDLDDIAQLVETQVKRKAAIALPSDIQPAKAYPRHPSTQQEHELYHRAEARGGELLNARKVAAFLVAGGQGTRLGYDGPKGEFAVTPIKNKPLFQVFAEQLLGWSRMYQRSIPWYIMTSDINDGPTREFFDRHNYFGYNRNDVTFFEQGMMPAFSFDGQMLLAEKDSLALSPDGHGGSLRALRKSGALADMQKRGVEHLSYFQVDNPLVYCIDPLFLGLHDLTGSEMSSKTIPKAGPLEKVGNFVMADGRLEVIEYSDLPETLAKQTNPDGSLKFNAGSIAIHALRVSFIDRLTKGGQLDLPWHRAEKKVPYVDDAGNEAKPDKPNAIKLEQFVFDAIPLAKNAIVYETERAEEFSPVKNAEGVDSPATSRRDQIRRAARWLTGGGANVPMKGSEPDAVIEFSPLFPKSEIPRLKSIPPIKPGERVYLGPEGIERDAQ